ncbi:adenosylcobinamide-phosphate synthase CbiB [uncultured Microscilla sp.]|uniref:adenosylcobinamide-phosphate synthase CbiB n=1 Tax=uncultured Microscilla sp. TaxID=432653 RepID=UPI002621FA95|nr:adenosylcobinamide-phosphate synthase CbiB [uncultured Microscilla sp.]
MHSYIGESLLPCLPLLLGYLLDLLLGDPRRLPHPIRWFGNSISLSEKLLNRGRARFLKGALLTIGLVALVFISLAFAEKWINQLHPLAGILLSTLGVFYGLANKSLIQEGKAVFDTLDQQGVEAGRKRLAWIVGRDTGQLSPQQIRVAVFETMSENLSDGVIAPLFFYALFGVPGIMAYKMVNTLDSMIGYHNDRYEQFGKFAARLDDLLNFVPARLTALLMVLVSFNGRALCFVYKYGRQHKSPNAGYPEAALAGILNCRFGGPNKYHGVWVPKPYIGQQERPISHPEFGRVATINHLTTALMVGFMVSLCIIEALPLI